MIGSDNTLIVIPTLNEAGTVRALLTQCLAESSAEIVVADGGSHDGTREIVKEIAAGNARVRLMHNPDRIQAAGINAAVAAHGGNAEWLVRMDAHCLYPPDYVGSLIAAAKQHEAASVVVPMVSKGLDCFQIAAATAQNSRIGTGGSAHRHVGAGGFVDHGHHALMRIAIFRQVGGYRPDMSHNEDFELDHRIGLAGGKIWLEPSLALTYFPRSTPRGLWRQYWNYGSGRARTVALHRTPLKLRQKIPLLVPLAAGLALLSPLTWLCAVPIAAWALLCLVGGMIVGLGAGRGCALLSGVAAMIMHMAWGLGFLRQRFGPAR